MIGERTRKTEPKNEYEGSARVLWVDDDALLRCCFKRLLQKFQYSGDTAANGQEALELLAKNQYDLMITDIKMPGMNGLQLAEEIKGKCKSLSFSCKLIC